MSNDQQYPYGQHGDHGQQGRQSQQGEQQGQYDQYGRPQQPSPYDAYQDAGASQGASQGWSEPAHSGQGHQDAGAQTWEGQTWDTQYQPQVQFQPGQQVPYQQQPQQVPYQQQVPYHEQPSQPQGQAPARHGQQSAAAPAAYLPPQGAYPLPPEVPAPVTASHEPPYEAPAPAAAQAAAPVDGYNAPTTMGNARITDAQRARAEGRSPIIPPGMQPAGLTAVLGLLLAGGAAIGPYALLVPLVLLQAVTAAGWFRLNGMWPARQGIALAFLGGIAADIALLAVGEENGPAAIIGTLGVWVLLTVVLQLRSRAGADERMQGLMATVASAALAILATGHLAAVPDAVVVGALAVAAATVARALPLPGIVSVLVALLAGAGAGFVAGGLTDLGAQGALLGIGAGVCALIGLRAASYDYPSRFVHMTAGMALPLTAAAPAVYLLGRVLS
ncbi:hypothetical protein ACFWM0_29085 [Streptomyces sp. NPDC058405]|uniref:hypothetical protein n=1 Tax=Streptomyces sp. NPDC058405 TaxID=3346482 RepID=UPI0036603539